MTRRASTSTSEGTLNPKLYEVLANYVPPWNAIADGNQPAWDGSTAEGP